MIRGQEEWRCAKMESEVWLMCGKSDEKQILATSKWNRAVPKQRCQCHLRTGLICATCTVATLPMLSPQTTIESAVYFNVSVTNTYLHHTVKCFVSDMQGLRAAGILHGLDGKFAQAFIGRIAARKAVTAKRKEA
jgi:hypothetical protein